MKIKFEKIRDVKSPEKAHNDDAGFDLFIPNDIENFDDYKLEGYGYLIPSGIRVELPDGYCGILFNKSSIACDGYRVGACVIDAGYRGEVKIHIIGSKHSHPLVAGKKIVQMLILPVPEVELVEEKISSITERADGGFGSTGDK